MTRIQSPASAPPHVAAADAAAAQPKISIIITSYNYAAYLREAIDSALGQTYPKVECIVVDDGSTDGSRDIIASYPRVKALLQDNGGQARAAKAGLRLATGSIVIFLDSDDFLQPEACSIVASHWREGMSALFYRLQIVEERRPTGRTWPDRPFLTGDLQAFTLRFGFVPSAPTSGNAFSRAHVERVFGMAQGLDQNSFDMALTNSAPFTGRVEVCDRALGAYRIHGANLTAYGKRQPLRSVRLGQYYAYHAQQTARALAKANGRALPAWDFLTGPYNLKTYLLTRGFEEPSPGVRDLALPDLALPDLALPKRDAFACAVEAAKQFAAYDALSWRKRAANCVAVALFALAPRGLRKRIAKKFYAIDCGS